jgi:hypothetical protein
MMMSAEAYHNLKAFSIAGLLPSSRPDVTVHTFGGQKTRPGLCPGAIN